MYYIVKETWYRIVHNNRLIAVLIIVQLCISTAIVDICGVNLLSVNGQLERWSGVLSQKDMLLLYYDIENVDMSAYLHSVARINDLKNYCNVFYNNSNFKAFEKIQQSILIETNEFKGKNIFLTGYEEGGIQYPERNDIKYYDIKNVAISRNVIDEYKLQASEGRLFKKEDMVLKKDNIIPVVLGSEYEGIYQIGSKIKGTYLLEYNCVLDVIGFLEKNSAITLQNKIYSLDRYMVIPAFNIPWDPEETEEALFFQGAYYLDKLSAEVKLKNEYTNHQFINFIEQTRLANDIGKFYIIDMNPFEMGAVQALSYSNMYEVICIGLLLLFLNILTVTAIFIYKFYHNSYYYSVLLISAWKISDIKKSILLENIILISIGVILGSIVAIYLVGESLFLWLFTVFVNMLILLPIVLYEKNFLNKICIDQMIRGNRND